MDLFRYREIGTELVLGLVAPIGADRDKAFQMLSDALAHYRYETQRIKLSEAITAMSTLPPPRDEYSRISGMMRAGNTLRKDTKVNGFLGFVAAQKISQIHDSLDGAGDEPGPKDLRLAFVIDSLKHPSEVAALREVYGTGFFLIALHAHEDRRRAYLVNQKAVDDDKARDLLERDENEDVGHGQSTRDTFYRADFFLHDNGSDDKLWWSIDRVLRLIFGDPRVPPTFNEYAMYSAFVSGMRSADLSRQVGAVLARDNRILSHGANEVPAYGGGQYWSSYDPSASRVIDEEGGRDFMRGYDSNHFAKEGLIKEVGDALEVSAAKRAKLRKTPLGDITEFGRAVHAEMDAVLACARSAESTAAATIYVTTFPCHNCAKHLISAGVERVFYIEPYPKSRALSLHGDAMSSKKEDIGSKMVLRPFVGVGPRQFARLFSAKLGEGHDLVRKDRRTGKAAKWVQETAVPRAQMLRMHYRLLEDAAAEFVSNAYAKLRKGT